LGRGLENVFRERRFGIGDVHGDYRDFEAVPAARSACQNGVERFPEALRFLPWLARSGKQQLVSAIILPFHSEGQLHAKLELVWWSDHARDNTGR
jgi:hypothetical protein